jgi:hypothetical protein
MDDKTTDRESGDGVTKPGALLLTGSLALLLTGLLTPAVFGIVYAAVGGAIGGLGLILLMVAIQAPLMFVVWKFLPKVNRDQEK